MTPDQQFGALVLLLLAAMIGLHVWAEYRVRQINRRRWDRRHGLAP